METRKKKSFKRLFAFLMAFVMVTSLAVSAVFAADPTFKDVPKSHEFYDEIEDLAGKDIIKGYGDSGLFKPENKLTRAQAAKMIALAADIKVSKGFKSAFTDIDEDTDMAEHIWALEEAKIVKGWGTTKEYRPDEEIQRGHVAKMVAQAFGIVDGKKAAAFSDLPTDKDVADAIVALAKNEIVKGYGDSGEFRPELPVERGQFAKMVSRAMNLKLEMLEAKAVNEKIVEATFSKDLGTLSTVNFKLSEKVSGSVLTLNSASGKGNVATITLDGKLADKKTYKLEAINVKAAAGPGLASAELEFEFLKGEPLSIAFKKTVVALGDIIEYVVKDAAGNDVTIEYPLDASNTAVIIENTNSAVVGLASADLKALTVGFAVINLKIRGTEIETGNTVIEVKDTLQVLTSIGRWTLTDSEGNGTLAKPITSVFVGDNDFGIVAEYLDQDGEDVDGLVVNTDVKFISKSPAILTAQEVGGAVLGHAVGKANVEIRATQGTKTVTKTIVIDVLAAPKPAKLVVTPKAVTLVKNATAIDEKLSVELYDQYDELFDDDTLGATFNWVIDKANVVGSIAADTPQSVALTVGEGVVTLTPGSADPTTAKITFTYGLGAITLKDTVTVKLVDPVNTFGGYLVETSAGTKLDYYQKLPYKQGPDTSVVSVFRLDGNGHKLEELSAASDEFELVLADPDNKVVDLSTKGSVKAKAKAGSQVVNVKVGTGVVQSLTFEVVDSTPKWKSVKQLKTEISGTANANLTTSLINFGATTGVAFRGYDQYGVEADIGGGWIAVSSNEIVTVDNTAHTVTAGAEAGYATVTFTFTTGEVYVVVIQVKAS